MTFKDLSDVAIDFLYPDKGKKTVQATEIFKQWAIVELMGHVRVAGLVTEEERFGAKLGRIDIPQPDGSFVTQYFGGSSVYRMTPCAEEIARGVTSSNYAPVHEWDLKRITTNVQADLEDDFEDDDETED